MNHTTNNTDRSNTDRHENPLLEACRRVGYGVYGPAKTEHIHDEAEPGARLSDCLRIDTSRGQVVRPLVLVSTSDTAPDHKAHVYDLGTDEMRTVPTRFLVRPEDDPQARALYNLLHSPAIIKHAVDLLIDVAHTTSAANGFWDDERNEGEAIALVHSELSEWLEGVREGNPPDDHLPEYRSSVTEMADVLVRVFDWAGGRSLPLADALLDKMAYNTGRGERHGKEF